VLSVIFAAALVVPAFLAPRTCISSLPPNIDAGLLQSDVITLLGRSSTFRQQCTRIAMAPYVRIRIDLGTPDERTSRAETRIQRYEAGAIHAAIVIRFSERYPEMLGHELEHVTEAMDGLKFRAEHAAGRAWMTPDGAFETDRARAAGLRVQEEFEAAVPHDATSAHVVRPAPR
jgi:hypothetical protein